MISHSSPAPAWFARPACTGHIMFEETGRTCPALSGKYFFVISPPVPPLPPPTHGTGLQMSPASCLQSWLLTSSQDDRRQPVRFFQQTRGETHVPWKGGFKGGGFIPGAARAQPSLLPECPVHHVDVQGSPWGQKRGKAPSSHGHRALLVLSSLVQP